MAKINEQLLIMSNRIIDSVWNACTKLGISYENFIEIINEVEDFALIDIFKKYGTRPYKKRELFNPVISEGNSDEDFREYLNRVSLSLSDILYTLEFHRNNLKKIKSSKTIYTKFFEKFNKNIDKTSSVILAQQDILLDLLQSVDENEMNEKLEFYLDSVG